MSENNLIEAKKNLKYKFMEQLLKNKRSSNPLVSAITKATMESMKSFHDTFGSSDSDLINSVKEKINQNEQFIKELKAIIKSTINKYKESCEYTTDEKEYNMIVILLDSILRHTSPSDTDSHRELLKYVTEISKLACGVTAKEKDYLIERYTQLLKTEKFSQSDFLKQIFDEIKNRYLKKKSSSLGNISLVTPNFHLRNSSSISNVPTIY
jgi:hypothetical protein